MIPSKIQWDLTDGPLSCDRAILVGGVNPLEKYARQNGFFPQGSGWK